MEWVPAIISIVGAVVVWVNAALMSFTGAGILDWVLPAWWGMPAEGLAYTKPIEGTCYIAIIQDGNARSDTAASTDDVVSVHGSGDVAAPADRPSERTHGTLDAAYGSAAVSSEGGLR